MFDLDYCNLCPLDFLKDGLLSLKETKCNPCLRRSLFSISRRNIFDEIPLAESPCSTQRMNCRAMLRLLPGTYAFESSSHEYCECANTRLDCYDVMLQAERAGEDPILDNTRPPSRLICIKGRFRGGVVRPSK